MGREPYHVQGKRALIAPNALVVAVQKDIKDQYLVN